MLQFDVKAISRKFFGHEVCLPERSLSQPKARCVCIRSIHQSNRSISVRLLFLFCSRVFISRSYENRSNGPCRLQQTSCGELSRSERHPPIEAKKETEQQQAPTQGVQKERESVNFKPKGCSLLMGTLKGTSPVGPYL